jgi:hypothetical protein
LDVHGIVGRRASTRNFADWKKSSVPLNALADKPRQLRGTGNILQLTPDIRGKNGA